MLMLVACAGESNEEDNEQSNEVEEASNIEEMIAAAIQLAGDSTMHEGTMEVHERIEEGESLLDEQMIESNYQQNESTGSDDTGYQLFYDKALL